MKSVIPPIAPVLLASLAVVKVGAFAPVSTHPISSVFLALSPPHTHSQYVSGAALSARTTDDVFVEEWTSLTDDGGVKIRTISPPSASDVALSDAAVEDSSPYLEAGTDVTVEYVGRIHPRDWSVDDIIACWLPEQGLGPLAPELFKGFHIDGERLMDSKKMSKKFIFEGLGVQREAKIDTFFRAAQDLAKSEETHPVGTVFDENKFTFRVGKGMTIRAFDLAIREMRVGQTASLIGRCDYAYGKRDLRAAGKILVPPYATVQYDLTLVEIN